MTSLFLPSEASKAQSSSMLEPIPTYNEATTTTPVPPPSIPPQPTPTDAPPAYAVLDTTQTTFTIYNTFIHNASGPAYQLSSPLDQRGVYFRIRRLRAKEVHQASTTPLAFDKSYILYEANDPPLLDNEYHIIGKRRQCLPGVLELKFRLHKWRVVHVPRPGAKGREILACKKVGAFGSTKLNRKRELDASQWKDSQGRVFATEALKVDRDGGIVPTVELSPDLDQTWRELMLTLWATRLWVAFGVERTAMEGGRYGGVRFAKFAGSAAVGGGGALLGLGVLGFGAGGS
ncbi:hypothetical protein K458DRAFT_423896 [Lentithecium fluviatile CBS 122367]|uniref:Uncharacterized protein n=1 Tax=Lentithecium fluviatile CBS 122367 TaxID=1168545 RepID=A0A6G1IGZ8_9PLEO|nr:hypothetical protein K458DRAFT_423896 [Lentithecium fluviatile CBS 122367]